MADLLMLIEEQRAAIREAERELAEALGAKAEWEKKITYLQWHTERLKRLYALTSSAAQGDTGHSQARLPIPSLPEKQGASNGRPGTAKQKIINVLRDSRRPMTAKEIWDVLRKQGVTINSERPVEVVASTMRSSMARNQNIFTKDGSNFGLVEWQGARAA